MSPDGKPTKSIDVYIRVSRVAGREGESFRSPGQQEERCRAQLAADGLKVGKVFIDLDQSGGKASRPAFDKMMARIEKSKSGGVVVHDLSRFGRNTKNVLDGIDFLEQHGAVFISCAEKLDTSTDSGRFMLTVFAALREMELRQLGARFLVSRQDAIAGGKYISKHVPPGYRKGPDGRLEPHPKHGRTISRAYEMAAHGAAPADIARYLNERELPSGDNPNPVWRSSRIKRLLGNPAYKGEARSGDIRNPNAHEPLTDEATWLRAQRQPSTRVRSDSNALLAGLVRCASCRRSMKQQAAGGRAPRTYRCPANHSEASYACLHPSTITADRLEDLVFGEYTERIFSQLDEPKVEQDDGAALSALAEARQSLAEVEQLKDTLRPAAYGAALDAALAEVEAAEHEVAARQSRGEIDVREALPILEQNMARVEAGGRVLDGLTEEGKPILRYAISQEMQAVFVRAAASRSKRLPLEDRVRIVWADDEPVELPTRGTHKELEPYTWD